MASTRIFPFTAIVGQQRMLRALLLNVVSLLFAAFTCVRARLSSTQLKRIVGVLLWLIAAKMIGDLFSLPALK